jgi:hypothetical protein
MILPVFIMLIAFESYAGLPSELSHIPCRFKMEKVLEKFGSIDKWSRSVDPSPGSQAFSSPTKDKDRTVEIQSLPDPYVFVHEKSKTKLYRWEGKDCIPTTVTEVKKPKTIANLSKKPECSIPEIPPSKDFFQVFCKDQTIKIDSPIVSPDRKQLLGLFDGFYYLYMRNEDSTCNLITVIDYPVEKINFKNNEIIFIAQRTVVKNYQPEVRREVFLLDKKTIRVRACE